MVPHSPFFSFFTFMFLFCGGKTDKEVEMIQPSKQTKHPAKGERMNKDKGPKFQLEVQKVGHKGAKEQIMFQSLHQ